VLVWRWLAISNVKVTKLPVGESGVERGRLTEDRQDALAEWYGKSEAEKKASGLPDPGAVAQLLGISAATVRRAKTDKRVMGKIREQLDQQLLYDVVEIRPVIKALAMDPEGKTDVRLKAARTIEELAGNLKKGPGVEINTTNVHPTVWQDMSDDQVLEAVERIAKERGFRKPE
jgi:hypothetical protein